MWCARGLRFRFLKKNLKTISVKLSILLFSIMFFIKLLLAMTVLLEKNLQPLKKVVVKIVWQIL